MNIIRSLIVFIIFASCCCLGAFVFLCENFVIDYALFDAYQGALPSLVLDDHGNELARFELDKSTPIDYAKLPRVLIDAFVAAEDHHFFKHYGISLRGIVRSTLVNLYRRRVVQGASTITQQLARLVFLSYERTWLRKIHEIIIALKLERQLSKQQIMELYLNNIYFGRGTYGVSAACKRFWNKSIEHVTLDEAATLAAVAKSARIYSPLNAPANALRRRNVILKSMLSLDFIDFDNYKLARNTPLRFKDHHVSGNPMRMYVQEWVRVWAERTFGKSALYTKGLRIKTTIDLDMQEKAESVFSEKIQDLRGMLGEEINGGMVSLDPSSGAIKVMIGGYDFKQSQYNRATQARRQTGSSFKPLVYALAMKAGIPMETVLVDEPFELTMPDGTVWRPMNWHHRFEGPMTLARALTVSNNIITIKLLMQIGTQYIQPWARLFGINKVTSYPSAALGTAEATVVENAAAFNVFANDGIYVKPYLIAWVKGAAGNKFWQHEPVSWRVLHSRLNARMVNLLGIRMKFAKKYARNGWIDAESIGKTGSTNEAKTTWFVGATPTLTTALYVGRDDNKTTEKRLLAGRTTRPMWLAFYKKLQFAKKQFVSDPGLREVEVDWVTGQPSRGCEGENIITLLNET